MGPTFKHGVGVILEANIDASRDLKTEDTKGHSGFCYKLGSEQSASFYFVSKKQSLVTRSSNEAEIYAIDFGMHEIEWLRRLLAFWRCPQHGATTIYEDNEAAINMLSGKMKLSTKSKHIQWRYKYAIQGIQQKTAQMTCIQTEDQFADKNIKNVKQFYLLRSLVLNCSNTIDGC